MVTAKILVAGEDGLGHVAQVQAEVLDLPGFADGLRERERSP
jgi:hypothetical protein